MRDCKSDRPTTLKTKVLKTARCLDGECSCLHSDFYGTVSKELSRTKGSIQGLLRSAAAAGHGSEKPALAPTTSCPLSQASVAGRISCYSYTNSSRSC